MMPASRSVLQNVIRSFRTSSVRRSGHDGPEGFPSANIPLNINNRYMLTATFIAFFGSGLAVPFLLLRYHLNK